MEKKSIFLTLLTVGSICASTEHNTQSDQVDVQQALVTSLLVFSVYEQAVQETEKPKSNFLDKKEQVPTKHVYKPETKRDKSLRRQQVNRRIQQYRRK